MLIARPADIEARERVQDVMAANHSPGDALSPFERRRLDELRRHLEMDDPRFAAALTEREPAAGSQRTPVQRAPDPSPATRIRAALLTVATAIVTAVVVLGAVVMYGFASVVGCLCSAFTMYGIFKLCSTADRTRQI
jgi:hypothetical protein